MAVKFKETDRILENPFLGTKITTKITILIAKVIWVGSIRKRGLPKGEYQRNQMKMTMMKMSSRKSKKKEEMREILFNQRIT